METIAAELSQILIDCLKKGEPKPESSGLFRLSTEHWQALLALAVRQRVRPLLWHRLRQNGLDEAVPIKTAEALRNASLLNTAHNLCLYGELRRLLSALKFEGIPLILLKGIFLAEAVYGNIGLREMDDIDLLARHADLTRISDILVGMGYTPLQPILAEITLKTGHHLPPLFKGGHATFEIHCNLTNPGERYSIDPKGSWERAIPVRVAGCDALALSPEDLLLHLCLHTSYNHQFTFGLRPSCDIAETIDHFGSTLDWQIVAERAIRRGWQRGVYLALLLAREFAGAFIPDDILEGLRPADMNETILGSARSQVFCDKNIAMPIPAKVADLLESRRTWDKIRIFWQSVFLPRVMIASIYSVPMNSVRIYGCYPRRVVDMLRRHGHTLKKYQQNDAPLKAHVKRSKLIADWLNKPAVSCWSSDGAEQHCFPDLPRR